MERHLKHHYFFINKESGYCFQYNNSDVANFTYEDESQFSLELNGKYNVLGAYFLRPNLTPAQSAEDVANWYHKVYNEMDENGEPVEEAGFTWVQFVPELVTEE